MIESASDTLYTDQFREHCQLIRLNSWITCRNAPHVCVFILAYSAKAATSDNTAHHSRVVGYVRVPVPSFYHCVAHVLSRLRIKGNVYACPVSCHGWGVARDNKHRTCTALKTRWHFAERVLQRSLSNLSATNLAYSAKAATREVKMDLRAAIGRLTQHE